MNWKQIVEDLQTAGMTQPQIAMKCGCGQSTISDLCNGKTSEPRHSLGESLLKLHKRNTSKYRPSDTKFKAVDTASL